MCAPALAFARAACLCAGHGFRKGRCTFHLVNVHFPLAVLGHCGSRLVIPTKNDRVRIDWRELLEPGACHCHPLSLVCPSIARSIVTGAPFCKNAPFVFTVFLHAQAMVGSCRLGQSVSDRSVFNVSQGATQIDVLEQNER